MQSHNFHQQRKVGQNHNYLFQIHRLPGNCQHTLKCGFGLTLTFCTLWSSSSLPFNVVANIYLHKVVLDRPGRNGDEVSAWSTKEMPDIIAKQRFPFSEYFKISETKLFALNISAWSRRCRELSRNWFFIVIIWYTLPEVLYIIKSINQVFLHMRPD